MLENLMRFLSTTSWTFELVLSDDGSTDKTLEIIEKWQDVMPLMVVRSKLNRGKGHAIRLGMLVAQGKIRVMCDADGSMPAEELPKLVEPLRNGTSHIVIGSRYLHGGRAKGQPGWRRAWGRFTRSFVKRKVVPCIEDTQCGYKAFSAPLAHEIFSRATINGWAFDLEVLALAQHLGQNIHEVSVDWTNNDRSRMRAMRGLFQVVSDTFIIKANFRRQLYGPKVTLYS